LSAAQNQKPKKKGAPRRQPFRMSFLFIAGLEK
jgi:hypothetical protein